MARKTHAHAIFPTPGHDHARCASDAIAHAEAICSARKERLTPIRHRVLEALLASHVPLGAYELIDRLAVRGARPAPITIYRALDFLIDNGLIHRIERMNAFIGCSHPGEAHRGFFLICGDCGNAEELHSDGLAETISSSANRRGFAARDMTLEVTGVCAECRRA